MPIPPIPLPPHLLPAAGAAARAGASSLLASALAWDLWNRTPEWVREDGSWRALSSGDGTDGEERHGGGGFADEMASLTAVLGKLEALVADGYDKLGSRRRRGRRRRIVLRAKASRRPDGGDGTAGAEGSSGSKALAKADGEDEDEAPRISTLEWHAALLAYWQLCSQIRERHPWWRDSMYRLDGVAGQEKEGKQEQEQQQSKPQQYQQQEQLQHKQQQQNGQYEQQPQKQQQQPQHEDEHQLEHQQKQQTQLKGETAGIAEKNDSRGDTSDGTNQLRQNGLEQPVTFADQRRIKSPSDIEMAEEKSQSVAADSPLEGSSEIICSNEDDGNRSFDDGPIATRAQVTELRVMLDYAVWAYELDEEALRSQLLTGEECPSGTYYRGDKVRYDRVDERRGYRLIVHRTTSYVDPDEQVVPAAGTDKSDPVDGKTKGKQKGKNKGKRKPPGRVGYFVAVSEGRRTILIGMKGTSTLEELLTDCCGRAVRVDLENDPHGPDCIGEANDDNDAPCANNGSQENDGDGSRGADGVVALQHHDKATKEYEVMDIPISPSLSTLHSNGNGLIDMIHASPSNVFPSDSVEVELVPDSQGGSDNTSGFDGDTNSTPRATQPQPTSKIKASPSENVLLLSSVSKGSPSKKQKDALSPVELVQSSTDEFIESHGIEIEANRSHKLRGAHEGILHCAQQLLFEISPLVEEYAVSKGYAIVCTGHSLGAGTAVLLAMLIRGKYSTLTEPCAVLGCDGTKACAASGRQRVRAYAFAPPPVLDRASSLACRHYVTSVVYNSDLIPRSSLTNLDVFLTVLEAVRSRLVETGMNPGGTSKPDKGKGSKPNVIASTIALFRKLTEGTGGELLLEPTELHTVWKEATADASLGDGENDEIFWDEDFGHHLFVPGKLLLLHESWVPAPSVTPEKAGPLHETPKGTHDDGDGGGDISPKDEHNAPDFHSKWTDGMATPLKGFELGAGSGMATNHLTTSYEQALKLLEEKFA